MRTLVKCYYCGKEVDFPFRCEYCKRYFCAEHRLPENHECQALPKSPLFWYQKKAFPIIRWSSGTLVCPKCGSTFVEVWAIGKENVSLQCAICKYKWKEPRAKFEENKK